MKNNPLMQTTSAIANWHDRCNKAQRQHYKKAENLDRYANFTSVPLIIASSIVTTTFFYKPENEVILFLLFGVNIIATVLAGVVSFSRFELRAEEHRLSAASYGKLKRDFEVLRLELESSSFNKISVDEIVLEIEKLQLAWEHIAKHSQITPKD